MRSHRSVKEEGGSRDQVRLSRCLCAYLDRRNDGRVDVGTGQRGAGGSGAGLTAFSLCETEGDERVGEVVACPAGGFGDVGEAEQA